MLHSTFVFKKIKSHIIPIYNTLNPLRMIISTLSFYHSINCSRFVSECVFALRTATASHCPITP